MVHDVFAVDVWYFPIGQPMHAVPLWYLPTPQPAHCPELVAPTADVLPLGQFLQLDRPQRLYFYLPAAQAGWQYLELVAPTAPVDLPLGQVMQSTFARLFWYLPFGQEMQTLLDVAPAVAEYLPFGQLAQKLLYALDLYLPAAHELVGEGGDGFTPALHSPEFVAPAALVLPLGQFLQEVDLMTFCHLPAGQLMHALPLAYFPTAQALQTTLAPA